MLCTNCNNQITKIECYSENENERLCTSCMILKERYMQEVIDFVNNSETTIAELKELIKQI